MSKEMNELTLTVVGMHSLSCADRIERALLETSGVVRAAVNLATGGVTVAFTAGEADTFDLVSSVRDAGYDVRTENLTLPIGGMTCASCAIHVEGALSDTPGVVTASVNLATEQATVTSIPGYAGLPELKAAVAEIGFLILERPDRAE